MPAAFFTERIGQVFTTSDILDREIHPEELPCKSPPPLRVKASSKLDGADGILDFQVRFNCEEWSEHQSLLTIVISANLRNVIKRIEASLATQFGDIKANLKVVLRKPWPRGSAWLK
jgi:hypothetical protein